MIVGEMLIGGTIGGTIGEMTRGVTQRKGHGRLTIREWGEVKREGMAGEAPRDLDPEIESEIPVVAIVLGAERMREKVRVAISHAGTFLPSEDPRQRGLEGAPGHGKVRTTVLEGAPVQSRMIKVYMEMLRTEEKLGCLIPKSGPSLGVERGVRLVCAYIFILLSERF